ncbi:EAL and GGDEF domain-containing protein [Nitrincola alkalilacustris]|uniref:sensor domain-containing protein n=1 Tax=Nitrincola alkalilacustris TaxID=1571224 RepID=UPI00124F156F|nr:EAL domain-containing protein [Nitrincola alkalilacustris]
MLKKTSIKVVLFSLLISTLLMLPISHGTVRANEQLLSSLFSQHSTVMLFIDPATGAIIDANQAAARFYGFSIEELKTMSIQDFNILDAEEVAKERERAQKEERSYFVFPHRSANRIIRTVEVHSSPLKLTDGREILFSVIHDITGKAIAEEELLTYQNRLQELVQQRTQQLQASQQQQRYILLGAIILQMLVIVVLLFNIRKRKEISDALRREQSALLDSRAYNRLLFDDSHLPLVVMDPINLSFLDCNEAAVDIYGAKTREELLSWKPGTVSPPFQHDGTSSGRLGYELIKECLNKGSLVFEWLHQRPSGELWDAEIRLVRFQHQDKTLLQFSVQDITERKRSDHEIRKLSQAVEQSPDSILITDLEGRIEYVNDAFLNNTGYTREEIQGENPRLLQSGLTPNETYEAMWSTLQRGETWRGELYNQRKNGSEMVEFVTIAPVRDTAGNVSHYLAIKQDISDKKQAAAQIHRLSFFDPLTGLPNRTLLMDRLEQACASGRHQHYQEALLLLNIDRFKLINDAHSLVTGDALLRAFANRIAGLLRESDTVARVAGDEFAILLPDPNKGHGQANRRALSVAEKIHQLLLQPINIDGEMFSVTTSIGITTFPEKANETPANIMRRADTALHRAKAGGGNQTSFFEIGMGEEAERSFRTERELRHGITVGELRLYLQPQVNSKREVVGAEVLVRWQHPAQGLLPPAVFIPIAEESDLIIELGTWVLTESCRLIAKQAQLGHPLHLSVNLSPRHFRQGNFVATVRQILSATGADPTSLTLEITEGLVIDNIDDVVAKMSALAELGIHFSVDDFGTGYSSLAYLKRLPIDELKIDRTFVQDAPNDPNDAALVETILAVASHMHLKVVAEGVETEEQAAFLNARGNVIHQGYLFGKPGPAEEWIAHWRSTGPVRQ